MGGPACQSSRGQSHRRIVVPDFDNAGSAFALRLWDEAIDPRNTIVTDYLASRGLSLPEDVACDVIRFHPALKLDTAPIGGMVALFRDIRSDQPCGIHRTFLDKTGRAVLDANGRKIRKMLGRAGGAAVKLAADEAVSLGLGIVEGVEDGLAVMLSGWQPIWVATTAGTIQRFPVLAGIEALTIFADADATGMAAAEECAARWVEAGKEARICPPPVKGPARD
jgi:putative DNA primase/helicase